MPYNWNGGPNPPSPSIRDDASDPLKEIIANLLDKAREDEKKREQKTAMQRADSAYRDMVTTAQRPTSGSGGFDDFSGGFSPSSLANLFGKEGGAGAGAGEGGGFGNLFGGDGGGGMSGFGGPMLWAYLIAMGKKAENARLSEDPDDPLGNFGLAMLAPSMAQIAEDPKGMGLPTLFGLPFLTPFTASDKSKQTKPEWSGFLGF